MKVKVTGPGGFELTVTNPDARMNQQIQDRIRVAVSQAINEFVEECRVEFRRLEPGEKKEISFTPFVMSLEKLADVAEPVA